MGYRKKIRLDFKGKGIIGVAGQNEAGKSSLLQAISYTLYGKTRTKKEIDLINDSADGPLIVECGITLASGDTVEITRGRTKKNEAILQISNFSQTKKATVDKHLGSILPLTWDDFRSLLYFEQGDIHHFMNGNKRTYFQRWTQNLKVWEQMEARAKGRLDKLGTEQEACQLKRQAAVQVCNLEPDILSALADMEKLSEEKNLVEQAAGQKVRQLQLDLEAAKAGTELKQ